MVLGGHVLGRAALVALLSAAGCVGAESSPAGGAAAEAAGSAELPAGSSPDATPAVSLTFDDLPGIALPGSGCDPDRLLALNERLLAALRREGITAAGLVTGSRMCEGAPPEALPAIYRRWLEEGHTLGNHTFSHRDLNTVELDWFVGDIVRNEQALEAVRTAAAPQRWFRAPFLHYGDTRAKHEGLGRWLETNGYRIARVSIDNQEWLFADVYGRAKTRGDSAVMNRVAAAYVPFMDSVFAFFEARTREVVGRYPPQVLLLHVNELSADHLDALVRMIRDRGYRIVPMEEALADPWYDEPDGYVGPRGLAWVHRRVATEGATAWPEEPREPAWLEELRQRYR